MAAPVQPEPPLRQRLADTLLDSYQQEVRKRTLAEAERIARRVISPLYHLPTLHMIIDHRRAERDDPDLEWVVCSPEWLRASGDCGIAPRRASENPDYPHLHPALDT